MGLLTRKKQMFDEQAEPIFVLLECKCQRRSQLLDNEDDICDKCGEKMRVVNKWKASEY